jgi:hypothetical protein
MTRSSVAFLQQFQRTRRLDQNKQLTLSVSTDMYKCRHFPALMFFNEGHMRTLDREELAVVAGGVHNIRVDGNQNGVEQNGNQSALFGGTVNAGSQLFQQTNIAAAQSVDASTHSGNTTTINI